MLHFVYAMHKVLICCLLTAALYSIPVHGQDTNITIDVDTLIELVLPSVLKPRVIGGYVTTNEKLGGYLMSLRYEKKFICGGTLLHDLIVLTAAHCFRNRPKTNEWIAAGGISKLSEVGIEREFRDIFRSAEFRENDTHMDVALVRLKSPMRGKGIGKLSLCSTNLKPGLELVVSGWGMTNVNVSGANNLLHSAVVPFIDKERCRTAYHPSSLILTDSMLCAGSLGKKDACTFDSGGPLVYKKQVCGIVSFGIGCASVRYPGVYTDINYVKPFIEKSMKELLANL
ncbi:seminase-like [Drosophila ficusphila]|uniref:seminase-like n=1 Tax=Drosophila ficusphila TaxID=30025 RepID=UPI0007E7655B|nr:seminase-like [Drosophila ficusphila]